MKPTIKDIAKELGLSVGTVERALNNRGRIKEETKRKVIEKANELGYQANTVARKLALRKKFKILVIMPNKPEYFWDDVILGVEFVEKELSEFGIIIIHFYFDPTKKENHPEILSILNEEKVDGIVIAPIRLKETDEIIQCANENRIPLITFNEDIISKNRLLYYGPDKELSGRMAGEVLAKLIGGKGCVCIFVNSNDLYTYTQRMQGFCGQLYRYYSQIKILNTYTYVNGREKELLENVINNYKQLNGIYIMDGSSGGHFACALKEMGCKEISLVAHECPENAEEMLKEGYIDALICEEKVCQGYYPIKLLYEYLVQGTLSDQKEIYSNIHIVMRENVNFIKYTGFGSGYR